MGNLKSPIAEIRLDSSLLHLNYGLAKVDLRDAINALLLKRPVVPCWLKSSSNKGAVGMQCPFLTPFFKKRNLVPVTIFFPKSIRSDFAQRHQKMKVIVILIFLWLWVMNRKVSDHASVD